MDQRSPAFENLGLHTACSYQEGQAPGHFGEFGGLQIVLDVGSNGGLEAACYGRDGGLLGGRRVGRGVLVELTDRKVCGLVVGRRVFPDDLDVGGTFFGFVTEKDGRV